MSSQLENFTLPDFIGKIANTYSQLVPTPGSDKPIPELEIRFDYFLPRLANQRLQSRIPSTVYYRLLNLPILTSRPSSQTTTTDTIYGSVRHQVSTGKSVWIYKKEQLRLTDTQHGVIASIASELPTAPVSGRAPDLVRQKDRTTFQFNNFYAQLDLTRVITTLTGKPEFTSFEAELEFLYDEKALRNGVSVATQITRFFLFSQMVFNWIYETNTVYTRSQVQDLKAQIAHRIPFHQNQIGEREETADLMNKARDLTLRDMVWGGLIGGTTQYRVTHKTDGKRRFLYCGPQGAWLIFPTTNEYNCLSHDPVDGDNIYLLDGELVTDLKNPVGYRVKNAKGQDRHFFWIFDCLIWESREVASIPDHDRRISMALDFKNYLETLLIPPAFLDRLDLQSKAFYGLGDVDDFYQLMRTLHTTTMTVPTPDGEPGSILPYEEDGLVFTPLNTPYHANHNRQKGLRTLVEEPDIVKWKPVEKLTVDFQLFWERAGGAYDLHGQVLVTPAGGNPYVRTFNQTIDSIIFTGDQLDQYPDLEHAIELDPSLHPSGTIVEFGWYPKGEFWYPYRIRTDKASPNSLITANGIWRLIEDPISWETLEGNTFDQVYRYHNSIKNKLFSEYRGYLVDIGSGRGGDLGKWSGYTKILAVEPDDRNRRELVRRLTDNPMKDRVRVIKAGGADTDVIVQAMREFFGPDQKADVVAMMLSMSFFWNSKTHVKELLRTWNGVLEENGVVLFLTIDGDSVENLYRPFGKETTLGRSIVFGGQDPVDHTDVSGKKPKVILNTIATLEWDGKKTVQVDIPNTIVGKQTEYLVKLGDLSLFSDRAYTLDGLQRATGEKFLPVSGRLFSGLYTYGHLNRDKAIKEELDFTDVQSYPVLPELKDVRLRIEQEEFVGEISNPLPILDLDQQPEQVPSAFPVIRFPSPIENSLLHSVLSGYNEDY